MKKYFVFLCILLLFGIVSQASADSLQLEFGDDWYLGAILPGTPSSEAAEAGYINELTTIGPNVYDDSTYDRIYDRTGSDLTGPFPVAISDYASNINVDATDPDTSLSPLFDYVLGKYGEDSLVWYIGGLDGYDEVLLPEEWKEGSFGGGLSHKVGFGVTPVPEPSTMLLLGSGLIGIAGFGRKFRKV